MPGIALALSRLQARLTFTGVRNGRRYIHRCLYSIFCNLVALRYRLRSVIGGFMELEYIVGLIVSFLIMGYLIYALLWPEKF